MERKKHFMKSVIIIALLVCILYPFVIKAEEPAIKDKSVKQTSTIMFPGGQAPRKFKTAIGLQFSHVPFDWVEMSVQAPLINVHTLYGLSPNFSLAADLTTLIISNQLKVGLNWNNKIYKAPFHLGIQGEYNYGFLSDFGYDSKMHAVLINATSSIGFHIKEIALSVHIEPSFLLWSGGSVGTKRGNGEFLTQLSNISNGGTLSFYVEQPFWKEKTCIVGLKLSYFKYFFPAWASYPTFDRYYLLPQALISFKL